ncbi:MAG TPA: hypothetical protein PLD20_28605 [Blastocatellia bacterium]|nr:hypothetical protein [Blastocatellia bacterium]HMV86992.1 hypothetical protein [Blastocatellia bacterium]HMX28881.1 hypothetical protein [Blastocatellia bacterium]HMY77091.1 hypothetical protein [Blastocatellia bacterium]HMZ21928.1 hypothetical protein [Blastocatellia bacterium]
MPFWLKDKLRLILAGLIFWAGLAICVLIAGAIFPDTVSPTWIGFGLAFVASCMFYAVDMLFNPPKSSAEQRQDYVQRLEQKSLLESASFQARRAFQVEEFEDEGSSYFLELEDGAVLFLSGQYLYEYEPIADDPELDPSRRFPCTEFTVKRYRQQGYCVDLICAGTVLEPEVLAPPFSEKDFREDRVPEDGQIITDRTYDALKQERLQQR